MDREQIFLRIREKDWNSVIGCLKSNPEAAHQDEIIAVAVKAFVAEFVREVETAPHATHKGLLETLFLLHHTNQFSFEPDDFARVTVTLIEQTPQLSMAYEYARRLPSHPVCEEVIRRYRAERERADAEHQKQHRFHGLRITENTLPDYTVDHRRPLFRSRQEIEFFMAVRESFPLFTVYPNVAVSSVIEFDGVQAALDAEDRDYFFRAIIDCVVFDHHAANATYLPTHFFELDSDLHDAPDRQVSDARKDRILAAAGQRLYRIRKTSQVAGQREFATLIREIVTADASM